LKPGRTTWKKIQSSQRFTFSGKMTKSQSLRKTVPLLSARPSDLDGRASLAKLNPTCALHAPSLPSGSWWRPLPMSTRKVRASTLACQDVSFPRDAENREMGMGFAHLFFDRHTAPRIVCARWCGRALHLTQQLKRRSTCVAADVRVRSPVVTRKPGLMRLRSWVGSWSRQDVLEKSSTAFLIRFPRFARSVTPTERAFLKQPLFYPLERRVAPHPFNSGNLGPREAE